MATNTFSGTGNWSDNARWSLGRPPTIANVDKVVIAAGAVCTIDGVYSCGDDTTTAFTINGTLKYSRSANTGMTFRGTVVTGPGGVWDQGTKADPIPAAYRCDVLFNDSAVMANGKYGFSFNAATAGFYAWGAEKTAATTMVALSSSSVFDVDDAVGWTVGDFLFFGPTAPGNATVEVRAIQSLSLVSGTRYTVTLTAALANANYIGRDVVNVTRNVSIKNKDAANFVSAFVMGLPATTSGDNVIELGPTEFVIGGHVAFVTAFRITAQKPTAVKEINGPVIHDIVSVAGSTVTTASLAGVVAANASTFSVETVTPAKNCAVATKLARRGIAAATASLSNYDGLVQIGQGACIAHNTNAIGAGGSLQITNPKFRGFTNLAGGPYLGYIKLTGGSVDGYTQLFNLASALAGGGLILDGCDLDGLIGSTTPSPIVGLTAAGVIADITINNCDAPAASGMTRVNNLRDAYFASKIFFKAKDQNPLVQQMYTTGGEIWRDNIVKMHGASSVRFDCWYSANPLNYSFTIKAAAGQTITLRGAMGYSTTYGTATPPTVALSGSGLTTQTANCALGGTLAADGSGAWNDYTLSITNTNAYPTDITVTYTGQSAANSTGAYCYFDGVTDSPWIDTAREFGYVYADTAYRTVDPSITVSEATALAYPVTFDHTAQTFVVTGDATARQVYEAFKASLAQTANMDATNAQANERVYTTDGGESFSTTYEGSLGSGVIVTGTYTDALGLHTSIEATLPATGCQIQLYDVTAGVELDNREVAGTTYSYPITYDTYTAGHTLRLRVAQVGASAAKLPQEVFAALTTGGARFTVPDEDDTVYAANGVDGSTCDASGGGEFTADYPNLQIDVSDVDGMTSVQRVYAWSAWANTTTLGIRLMFGAVEALDTLNYVIHQDVVDAKFDNVNGALVLIAGGYIRRADGTTVIAAASNSIQMDPGRAYVADGASLAADVWAAPSRTLTDGAAAEITAIKAKTDNLPAAPAAVGDIPTAAQNADKLLGRNLAGAADGGRTVKDALRASRNKSQLSGGTLTVYREDDATPAWTADVTTASRDPVSGIDPT